MAGPPTPPATVEISPAAKAGHTPAAAGPPPARIAPHASAATMLQLRQIRPALIAHTSTPPFVPGTYEHDARASRGERHPTTSLETRAGPATERPRGRRLVLNRRWARCGPPSRTGWPARPRTGRAWSAGWAAAGW